MSRQATVFVTRRIPEVGLAMIRDCCEMRIWEEALPPPKDVILEQVAGCRGLLCLVSDEVDGQVMDAGDLRVISQYAVGVDNIDLDAATKRGIPVGHTPGVLTDATADLTFALLMAAARRIPEGIETVQGGDWRAWDPLGFLGADIWGATLGIVGLGRIGTAVARRARGFRMRILYNDPDRAPDLEAELGLIYASLGVLLEESDFVTVHTPLVPETHHLVDEAALRRMKDTAILVNAARGEIVDTEALVRALEQGWIARAALDVTDPEPIPADHPLVRMGNCIIVPHIGSATVTARDRMAEIAAENLLAGVREERLPHCANPEVYEVGAG